MPFVSKLYVGCTIRLKSAWSEARPDLPIPSVALEAFQAEGIHILSTRFAPDNLQLLAEIQADVSPAFLIQRLKGRLSHSLKRAHHDFPGFSRHFFLRSLGQNTKSIVSNYVHSQIESSDLVDPLYRSRMKELRFKEENEILPSKTRHQGVYDLFAHVVLITGGRTRMFSPEAKKVFEALCEGVQSLKADPMDISMMPDHVHLLLRWPQSSTARELLENIQKASGQILRRSAFWTTGGYVGSVGPYPLKIAMDRNSRLGIKTVPHSG